MVKSLNVSGILKVRVLWAGLCVIALTACLGNVSSWRMVL